MCISPITIFNRSTNIGNYSPTVMQVACGKCLDCLDKKVLDYQVRCEFEFFDCLQKGGYGYFDTLTYSPKFLPHIEDIPTFSKSDISKFFKRLRINLERSLGFSVAQKLKYFVTCEFGDTYGRSHYHIIFFVSTPKIPLWCLKRNIVKSWYLGWTDKYSNTKKHVMTSSACIRYISKYVKKPQEWYNIYRDKLDVILSNSSDSFQKRKQLFHSIRPFQRCSNDLGVNWLLHGNRNDDDGTVVISTKNGKMSVPMSIYYKHKLYYTLTKTHIGNLFDGKDVYNYKKNDLGISLDIDSLNKRIDKKVMDYRNACISSVEFNNAVLRTSARFNIRNLAIYDLVFRGCNLGHNIPVDKYEDFYIISRYPSSTFVNPLYCDDKLDRQDIRDMFLSNMIDQNCTQYRGFDDCLEIFYRLKYQNGEKRCQKNAVVTSYKNLINYGKPVRDESKDKRLSISELST